MMAAAGPDHGVGAGAFIQQKYRGDAVGIGQVYEQTLLFVVPVKRLVPVRTPDAAVAILLYPHGPGARVAAWIVEAAHVGEFFCGNIETKQMLARECDPNPAFRIGIDLAFGFGAAGNFEKFGFLGFGIEAHQQGVG